MTFWLADMALEHKRGFDAVTGCAGYTCCGVPMVMEKLDSVQLLAVTLSANQRYDPRDFTPHDDKKIT